ncbi:hypothetical protein [Microbacterium resistens]
MGTYISRGGPATQVRAVNRVQNPRNVGWSTGVCVGYANDWKANEFEYGFYQSATYGTCGAAKRTAAGSGACGFHLTGPLDVASPGGPSIPVGAGQSIDLSTMVYRVDSAEYKWRHRFANATGWVTDPSPTPSVTGAGWIEVRASVAIPAGATRLFARFECHTPLDVGARIIAAQPFAGTTGHAYFDGSTEPTAAYSYQWTGAADRSSSVEVIGVPVVQPNQVDGYQAGRPGGTVVHRIIGSATPDVVMMPGGLRVGRLRLIVADATAAFNGLQALSAPEVFDLVSDERPGISMKFVIPDGQEIGLRLDDATRDVWILDVPFQEVGG